MYGFCDASASVAIEEYQRHFPNQRIPSQGVSAHVHQTMHETGRLPKYFCVVWKGSGTWHLHMNVYEMIQRSLQLPTHRIVCRIGVSHMQMWWILHEKNLHPYLSWMVEHFGPGDLVQHKNLYHWVTAHHQLSAALFTDDESFTWDGKNNSQNSHLVPWKCTWNKSNQFPKDIFSECVVWFP